MKSVILLAAALAAGLSSFAADAANSDRTEPFRPKAQNIQKTTGLKVESSQHSDRQNRSVAAVTAKKKAAAPKKSEKSATSAAKAAASKFAKSSKEASRMKKPPVTRKTTKRGPKNTAKIDITTTASINTSGWGRAYGEIVSRYAAAYGVPASLAHAVIRVESNYRPNARGSAGEIGLMQIKPSTARMMGYSGSTSGLFASRPGGRSEQSERKVRAPGNTAPDNVRRGRPQGKCHREQTAGPRGHGKGERVG
jgi:soluble lytic murein transglycosylase-like protein